MPAVAAPESTAGIEAVRFPLEGFKELQQLETTNSYKFNYIHTYVFGHLKDTVSWINLVKRSLWLILRDIAGLPYGYIAKKNNLPAYHSLEGSASFTEKNHAISLVLCCCRQSLSKLLSSELGILAEIIALHLFHITYSTLFSHLTILVKKQGHDTITCSRNPSEPSWSIFCGFQCTERTRSCFVANPGCYKSLGVAQKKLKKVPMFLTASTRIKSHHAGSSHIDSVVHGVRKVRQHRTTQNVTEWLMTDFGCAATLGKRDGSFWCNLLGQTRMALWLPDPGATPRNKSQWHSSECSEYEIYLAHPCQSTIPNI